jgi:HAD superfamily phosphoserine phosphatase-like hydrolase
MTKLVLFDLDGTLLEGLSSENSFVLYLLKKGYIRSHQISAYIKFLIKWFPKYHIYTFIKNKAYLAHLSVDKICDLGQKFVKEHLISRVRPTLVNAIEQHRAAGDILVLLSGTHQFIAEAFGKLLNIPHVEATKCVLKDNRFTQLPPKQHPFAREKLDITRRLCRQYGLTLERCVAYGNSCNDLFLLSSVGFPVAVYPDWKLRKIAQRKHWKLID